ncbi:uncharacterized protein [Montipora capricornis]
MTSIFTSLKDCHHPRIVLIVGEPGMGKTTHCQKLAYDWTTKQDCKWDESFPRVDVVVLLRCRENLIESSIWESIEDEIMPKGTAPELKETFFRFLGGNPSNVLLVLDGLDEAEPQKLAVYFDLVQGKLLRGCQIVHTSRYEAQKDAATHSDTLLEIVGFTKSDAECLIRKHFQHAGQMTGKLIRVLWHQNDDGDHSGDDQHIQGNLKELTKSPFNVLPNVTQLYVEIVRCLLKQCEIKNHLPSCGIDLFSVYKEDLMTLGRMALESLCKGELHFEVVEGNFKESLFIKFGFLSVQAGGRKRTSCFRYSFFNKSFQEFFSGLYLAFSILDGEIDKKSVLTDERFFGQARQVFVFMNEIIALQSKETAVSLAVSRANLEDRISSASSSCQSDIIEWIRQIYHKREGVVFPVPWCEGFSFQLENIFTRLRIVAKEKTRGTLTKEITNMTSIFTSHEDCQHPRIVLIEGEPGMGKTTYCQKLAYDWATKQDREWDESFPRVEALLLLRCREIESTIWEAIDDQIIPRGTDPELKETFFRFVQENPSKVLLVLDGLDEADPQKLAVYFDLIQGKLLPGCHIVLTSRHEAGNKVVPYLDTLLEIVGFTTSNAKCFIRKYFRHAGQIAEKLIKVLWHPYDDDGQHIEKNLKELTKNPLTTLLLCVLFEDFGGVLPNNTTQLYLEIVLFVLRRYEMKNHLPRSGKDLLSVYRKELTTLGRMALECLFNGELHLEDVEGSFKESLFIKFGFLSVQAGGRKRTPCFRYSFFNKSFQEFFSGLYLAFSILDGEIDKKSVLTDERFFGQARQVFVFMNEIIALQSEETEVSLAVSHANVEDRRSSGSSVPLEIQARGSEAVYAFQKAMQTGKVKVYRGRIMLLGQDRAGKTSLKKSLLGLPFDPWQESTVGVEVDPSTFEIGVDHVMNWTPSERNKLEAGSEFEREIARLIANDLAQTETDKKNTESQLDQVQKSSLAEGVEDQENVKLSANEAESSSYMDQKSEIAEEVGKSKDEGPVEKSNGLELNIDTVTLPSNVADLVVRYLQNLRLENDVKKEEVILTLWDFAGQHLYYAAHSVFLSQRAVYVLVYNLNKSLLAEAKPFCRQGINEILLDNLNNESNLDNLLSWLVSVHSIGSVAVDANKNLENQRKKLPYLRPPVIIVGTHADQPFEDVKATEKHIKDRILGKEYAKHVITTYFAVNNKAENDEGVQKLRQKIMEVLRNEPYMGEEVPLRWFNFEKVLEALVAKSMYHMDLDQLLPVIKQVCRIDDEDETTAMLNFYHDLGVIVKHGRTVVLQAQWLIDLFKQLITVPRYDEADPLCVNCWKELQDTGILRTALVDHVFADFIEKGHLKQDILEMMELYGLIAKFSSGMSTSGNEEEQIYFVPTQLTSSPSELCEIKPSEWDPCPLFVYFLDGFLPHGLFPQFVSRCISWYSENGFTETPKLFNNGASFSLGKQFILVFICRNHFIKVVLKRLPCSPSSRNASNKMAIKVRTFIEGTLNSLSQNLSWLSNLRYQLSVACTHCLQSGQDDSLHLLQVLPCGELVSCQRNFSHVTVTVPGLEKWFELQHFQVGTNHHLKCQSSLKEMEVSAAKGIGVRAPRSCGLDPCVLSKDEESATFQGNYFELQEQGNKLVEQLRLSEAENQQLKAELGRYQFLEDREKRSGKFLSVPKPSASDDSRFRGARTSFKCVSTNGRRLGEAASLQEKPDFNLQARFIEISNSLSAEEFNQMKTLARGKVDGFRLAKMKVGFELLKEVERVSEHPCTDIRELLQEIQRFDLLEKLGSPSLGSKNSEIAGTSSHSLPSRDERLRDLEQEQGEGRCTTSIVSIAHRSEDSGQTFTPDNDYDLSASVSFESDSENPVSINIEDNDPLFIESVGTNDKEGICVPNSPDQSGPLSDGSSISVGSFDSLVLSTAEGTLVCSSGSSEASSEKLSKAPEVALTTHSSIAPGEFAIESNLSGIEEEVPSQAQLLNSRDNVTDGEKTEVEYMEGQCVDTCHGATGTSRSDTRASPLSKHDSQISSSDSSAFCRLTDPVSSHVDDGNPLKLQRGFNAHGQTTLRMHKSDAASSSSTDWERLGARPKSSQTQRPLFSISPPPPPLIVSPVFDGLDGDFLVRHSQDKAVHESLFTYGRDFSVRSNDTSQGVSFVDGNTSASESYRARPYFGACQAAVGNNSYVRSDGSAFSHVRSGGFERAGLLGGSSSNESLYGYSAPAASAPLDRHTGLSNSTLGWNGSSRNGANNVDGYFPTSGFLNIDHGVTTQREYNRESPFPYVRHNTHAGQTPLHWRSKEMSEITPSGFAYELTSSGFPFGPLGDGAPGIRLGQSVCDTRRHVVSDGGSAFIDVQAGNEGSHNADLALGQQSLANRHYEPGTSAGSDVIVDNCSLPPPFSVSASSVSSTRVVSSTTSGPLVISASDNTPSLVNNTSANSVFPATTPGNGNSETSLAPSSGNVDEDNSRGALLNRDNGTNCMEPVDDSLALERRAADASALIQRVLREREEREQFGREIERKERMIRERRERERREREEKEMQEAERWPQQQEAVTARSPWLCEHYQRHCRVRFPCCTQFYPCHRCHNSSRNCENEEAKACHATHLKCSFCQHEQEIDENSGVCGKCSAKMAAYFCSICKHFTNVDKNPYHCEKCGICRIHADKSFHCEVCNVCLDKRLEGNHKCRPDSGHDECCICLEDAFSGCQILPCSHKVHRECAIAMIQNGIRTCPVCRHPLYSAPSE